VIKVRPHERTTAASRTIPKYKITGFSFFMISTSYWLLNRQGEISLQIDFVSLERYNVIKMYTS
jgi:hypothetical protein